MRIDRLQRRRSGSVALEAIMVVPVVIILVMLGRFILEGMLARHEFAIHSRNTAARAALLVSEDMGAFELGAGCLLNPSEAGPRAAVTRTISATCAWRNAEEGLRENDRIFTVLDHAAQTASALFLHDDLRRIPAWNEVRDVESTGIGAMQFEHPPFLVNQGGTAHEQVQLRSRADLWTYAGNSDDAWKWGHDRAFWQQLMGGRDYFTVRIPYSFLSYPVPVSGHARELFPNVFPARNER